MVVGDFPIELDTVVVGADPWWIRCGNSCSTIRSKGSNY